MCELLVGSGLWLPSHQQVERPLGILQRTVSFLVSSQTLACVFPMARFQIFSLRSFGNKVLPILRSESLGLRPSTSNHQPPRREGFSAYSTYLVAAYEAPKYARTKLCTIRHQKRHEGHHSPHVMDLGHPGRCLASNGSFTGLPVDGIPRSLIAGIAIQLTGIV